jgi:hypothetical protein
LWFGENIIIYYVLVNKTGRKKWVKKERIIKKACEKEKYGK